MNVVVPLYRTALNPDEWLSLERCFAVLGGYPITFVIPEGLDMTPVMMRFPSCRIESFDPSFFAGRYGYNHLMLSAEFYRRFLNWEYILIYQTDAFVFRDELAQWCARGYDYIGAPWPSRPLYANPVYKVCSRLKSLLSGKNHYQRHIVRNKVGNGGLSLRRTGTIYRLLTDHADRVAYYKERVAESHYYEDVFFAVEAPKLEPNFSIPPVEVAAHFSFDTYPWLCYQLNGGHVPFGCHGFNRRRRARFWNPIIAASMGAGQAALHQGENSDFHSSRIGLHNRMVRRLLCFFRLGT